MKGLELARKYWEEYGLPMLREQFPEYLEVVSSGLTGAGSECYGYDDAVSGDHDLEPGFCLFLPGEEVVDRKTEFRMERAYAKLPSEYGGLHRSKMGPVGGHRRGVFRLEEFFAEKLGCPAESMTDRDWLRIPEEALAEAVNGEVFYDPAGLLTDIRTMLRRMPENARRKRLAGHLLMMGQSAQYNYRRCLQHGETGAAQLAAGEFVRHTIHAFFLLKGSCAPYYKWQFRALRGLSGGEELARSLEWLLTTGNEGALREDQAFCMEGIAAEIIDLLQEQHLTEAVCGDLEKHAYSVNDGIRDSEIRNLHILCCV